MFGYFAPVTRHSFQAMCTVFSRKDFSKLFDGLLRISTRKTNAEPRCLTSLSGHDGAIWAAKHLDLVHVHYLANPFTDLTNSLRGTKYFLRETNTVFRDTNNSLRGTRYFLWETNAVFRGTANSLRGTFGETNYLRDGNRNLAYEKIVNTTVRGYFYLNHAYMYLRSVPGLQYDNIHTGNTNVSNDLLVNTVKLTDIVNDCIKQSQLCKKRVTRRVRDREPSRISLRRVMKSLKRRKLRKKHKLLIKKSVPVSSVLYSIATNYKQWHIKYANRQDSFYSSHYMKSMRTTTAYTCNMSDMHILLSGDIELNPGPRTRTMICNESSNFLLQYRLLRHGLKPLDVGGGGDYFFKSVSHQLYGNPSQHLAIRATGIQYLRENPERFIESNLETSWLEYLKNMTMQGTWADDIIIQAVADAMNLMIHIVESNENFIEITVVEAANVIQNPRSIFIGHIGEMHYISTVAALSERSSTVNSSKSNTNNCKRKCNDEMEDQNKQLSGSMVESQSPADKECSNESAISKQPAASISKKRKIQKANFMRQYRANKMTAEEKEKHRINMKKYRASKVTAEDKAVNNAYKKRYRASVQSPDQKIKHNSYQKTYRAKQKNTIEASILKFHKMIAQGPLYICTCCDQLWYKHGVVNANKLRESNPNICQYLCNKTSVDNIEWVCKTCHKYLVKNKIPSCAVVNGMVFSPKPAFFDLNELECRLLAPRIAFQKLMQAPRGRQLKIHGNIVNVPADVTHTVSMLPRLPSETGTIKVNLKRKLQYKSSALSLNVRPHKVVEAADWLMTNSSLNKDEGISFNPQWVNQYNEEIVLHEDVDNVYDDNSDTVESNEHDKQSTVIDGNSTNIDFQTIDHKDEWSEDEIETPAGVTDTMLTSTDFLEDNERQNILNVAPAEGNRPLSIFRDKYSEELAYPGIFLGQRRLESKAQTTKVLYSDICKSELRRSDRRAAMCVENIFYKTKKLQMKILLGQSHIALRKCKGNNKNLKAGHLKQQGALDRLMHHDEGFKFLKALRGSPPYFEKAKKDLFAMIRQLGPATLFCSFSSAETQWIHLLQILGQLVDHKQYTDDELENLNWEEKCRLIQTDPVTCARHFDYQVNQFLTNFLLGSAEPLGTISDWFYRVEYQQRGSPHIHMLIWLDGAPEFQVKSDAEVTGFIDNIITCQKPTDNPELLSLVNRQVHRHSHTCRNTKSECRFNYPQPPMRQTKILYPLDTEMPQSKVKVHKDTWKSIKKHLDDMKEGKDITFDELLLDLNVTEENYLFAVSSSLKAATVFLKRNPNELRINNYNAACLSAWRANMEIQFVLDVYACAVYIVN